MNIELQKSIRNYIYSLPTKDCLSVTLTMKQVVENEYLDEEKSVKNFRHFLNLLNKRVYGNANKRFKKSISVIPVLYSIDSNSDNFLSFSLAFSQFNKLGLISVKKRQI